VDATIVAEEDDGEGGDDDADQLRLEVSRSCTSSQPGSVSL
jgi:hypothetical protein